jgi:hypothetical protein
MAANLEDVPSVELITEVLRRAKCSSKPDKRIILVGKTIVPPYPLIIPSAIAGSRPMSLPLL